MRRVRTGQGRAGDEDTRRSGVRGETAARNRRRRSRRTEGRRGARRDHGDRPLPHRRLHARRPRQRGPVPLHPRPRRRRHRPRDRRGGDLGEAGRPRDPALHAGMPAVQKLPFGQDQSLHRDPRDAGVRPDAGRHEPLQPRRQDPVPLHGLLDLLELHRAARDRGRPHPRRRAVQERLLCRLRRHHRRRCRGQHREGDARRQRGRVRPRRHRAQRDPGRPPGRCRPHHRRRPQRQEGGVGPTLRHDRISSIRPASTATSSPISSRSPTAAPTGRSTAPATPT